MAIFIIGLLIAIIIPAIMAAREGSRRLYCSNNLKQIGLGLASYATASGAFPGSMGVHSPLVRILPFIDQMPLYNSVNLSSNSIDITLINTNIGSFACPSDGSAWRAPGMTNYAVNGGISGLVNAPFSWNVHLPFIGYQHITDGLSTTAIAAEWLTGVPPAIRDAKRSVFGTGAPLLKASMFDKFTENCRNLDPATAILNGTIKGHGWANPGFGLTLYNHALLPDEHTCTNGTLTLQGAWTTGSSHGDGVNVGFADGHVSHARKTMARATWRAIGTMNGQEAIEVY